ncbi:hypothetical protein OUZ56_016619 [Daphnia magna]|uniref:Uncharacterized protein n=1 Tax=Daphnia magna TaxID=35525 RepID=A0ABR0AR34_9CRUS|nr:hypothetical protein OUZ56_016619 [Daphnia magna]
MRCNGKTWGRMVWLRNSDDELDTTRQRVVVAGDEEAHSHQQSTPSPTVTDDEPIHPSLVLGKGELLSFYMRYCQSLALIACCTC